NITNSGGMETKGWGLNLNFNILDNKDFKWYLGFNISHNQSVVTKLPFEKQISHYAGGELVTKVGNAPNLFYGYETNGIYATDAGASKIGLVNIGKDGTLTNLSGG